MSRILNQGMLTGRHNTKTLEHTARHDAEQLAKEIAVDTLKRARKILYSQQEIEMVEDSDPPIFNINFSSAFGHLQGIYDPLSAIRLIMGITDGFIHTQAAQEVWTAEECTQKFMTFIGDAAMNLLKTFTPIQMAALELGFKLALVQAVRVENLTLGENLAFIKADRDESEWIEDELQIFNKYIKKLVSAPQRGQASDWTKLSLARALLGIFDTIPKKRDRSYENVNKKLKEIYGEKAPESGEGLRKLVKRQGLNWVKLKNGQY